MGRTGKNPGRPPTHFFFADAPHTFFSQTPPTHFYFFISSPPPPTESQMKRPLDGLTICPSRATIVDVLLLRAIPFKILGGGGMEKKLKICGGGGSAKNLKYVQGGGSAKKKKYVWGGGRRNFQIAPHIRF